MSVSPIGNGGEKGGFIRARSCKNEEMFMLNM